MTAKPALAMALAVITAWTPFIAQPAIDNDPEALEIVEAVAPELNRPIALAEVSGGAVATVPIQMGDFEAEAVVEASEDEVAVDLEFHDGTVEVVVSTPLAATTDATLDVTDGAAVSESAELGLSQIAQTDADGVRMTTVISDAGAIAPLEYDFEGVVLLPAEDGSVDVGVQGEVGALVLGKVEAPWATDADGTALETHYEVVGQTLVQHVEVDTDTAFPVVADPYLRWTNNSGNFEIRWSRAETSTLARGGYGPAFDFASTCAGFGWIHPAAYAALWATCFDGYARFVTAAKAAMTTTACVKVNGDISPFWVLGPLPYTCVKSY